MGQTARVIDQDIDFSVAEATLKPVRDLAPGTLIKFR
jgi:hypothetical protein